jgi:YkoY family integral membrane protein
MLFELLANSGLSSVFTVEALYVVLSLVLIEGLLSVDNALAIAAMASHLEEKQRKVAMTVGYAGAYGFRLVALLIANLIINNHWLMMMGAAYLVWLMCDHFAKVEDTEEGVAGGKQHHSFAKTIAMIAFLDLSLSFDNVVAAVAFARDNIWLVYIGVTIGIITLRLVAGYCIKLLAKHPWLEHTAFILVGFVGLLLCAELYWDQVIKREVVLAGIEVVSESEGGHFHIEKIAKFGGIILIIVTHILYEKNAVVRAALNPLLVPVRHLLAIVAHTVGLIFGAITFPFRRLFAVIKGQ